MKKTKKKAAGRFPLATSAATGVAVAALLALGCTVPETAVRAENDGEPGERVLAVVGERQITEAEVEEAVAADLLDLERQRQTRLEVGLRRLVEQTLLEIEAESEGVTPEEFLEAELAARYAPPTDEEVESFYEERKARIREPKEQVLPQIRQFLEQQGIPERNRAALIEELKEKHGYTSRIEPLRVEVEADGHPSKGPADAPVTIVEFSDFECPFCSRVLPTLDQVMDKYGDKVRLVFRQFPLVSIHPRAFKAAEASLCADDQGKFWEMHDAMFREQRNLGDEQLKEKAARLGLDTETFNDCLDSGRYEKQVNDDLRDGQKLGVTGTPAAFINGRFLSGAVPYDEFARLIEEELE